MKYWLTGASVLCIALSSCDKKEKVTPVPPVRVYTTAVSISENGAPPYVLPEASINQATYQGPTALLVVSGKTNSGSTIRLTFGQSSPSAAGANTTDQVEVYSDKAGEAVQASGRTTRNSADNTVSGNFTARFANGTTLNGTIATLKLQ